MKRYLVAAFALLLTAEIIAEEKYQPDWDSLAQHEAAPEWLKDAKLGIYFHWGPYCVPAYSSEWYPRHMYMPHRGEYKHHRKKYGRQKDFNYHDFIPMFTGEHFDPDEWADLFQKSGARFAGPVAEHHDGYAMWESKITPWNAASTGPKRDVLGELFSSLRKRELKTIATFHHARNLQRFVETWKDELNSGEDGSFNESHFPYNPKWATASDDPKLALLYGNIPEEEWLETVWLGKLKEVIDNYQPDAIWFDSWLDDIPETYQQQFAAYYFNAANRWSKEVAVTRKQNDLPLTFSVLDHEKSREPEAKPELWLTDDTISTGSWCYTDNLTIKPLDMVIHALIDAVSKNGVVLLNISPKADGTIPQDQRDILLGLGAWLKENGKAIYNTRPWTTAAEGPAAAPPGSHSARDEFLELEYSHRDVRYTASKDGKTIYAILMGTPPSGKRITLKAFDDADFKILEVKILHGDELDWKTVSNGIQISMPREKREKALTTILKISIEPKE